jgi:hypothetical protein
MFFATVVGLLVLNFAFGSSSASADDGDDASLTGAVGGLVSDVTKPVHKTVTAVTHKVASTVQHTAATTTAATRESSTFGGENQSGKS